MNGQALKEPVTRGMVRGSGSINCLQTYTNNNTTTGSNNNSNSNSIRTNKISGRNVSRALLVQPIYFLRRITFAWKSEGDTRTRYIALQQYYHHTYQKTRRVGHAIDTVEYTNTVQHYCSRGQYHLNTGGCFTPGGCPPPPLPPTRRPITTNSSSSGLHLCLHRWAIHWGTLV